jgi:hypothetical protein
VYALTRAGAVLYRVYQFNDATKTREKTRKRMTQAINNRRKNQTNRNKLAARAKKAKKERNRLG